MKYIIRKSILDMTSGMWRKSDSIYPNEILVVSPQEFLEKIGLPSGHSANFNENEKLFFSEIYRMYRETR